MRAPEDESAKQRYTKRMPKHLTQHPHINHATDSCSTGATSALETHHTVFWHDHYGTKAKNSLEQKNTPRRTIGPGCHRSRDWGGGRIGSGGEQQRQGPAWGSGNSWESCPEEASLGLRIYRVGAGIRRLLPSCNRRDRAAELVEVQRTFESSLKITFF